MATSTKAAPSAAKAAPAAKKAPAKQAAPAKKEPAKKAEPVAYDGNNVQPNSESQIKLRQSEAWQRIANNKLGEAYKVAWSRPEYGMFKAGVRGPWATICIHGTVRQGEHAEYPVTKGAEAETAGKHRAEWCPRCKAALAPAAEPAKKAAPAKKATAAAPGKAQAPKPGPSKAVQAKQAEAAKQAEPAKAEPAA